ncbi:MAG: uroporphyrinogen decarboxylase family protein [Opitutaceae bacterium]
MLRAQLLELAARGHRVPIGADLVLHENSDPEGILREGTRLGAVVAETAARFRTPLAFPVMDLRLEKAELLRFFDVPAAEVERFHFATAPDAELRRAYARAAGEIAPGARVAANLGALRHVARQPGLLPIGMCIGPFSLTTKLMADPITPVCLAGAGIGAAEDESVALLEACLELSLTCVLAQVRRALEAGARAVFVAEPAANQVYFSPLQLEEEGGLFERFVLAPNRQIAELLAAGDADLLFHCCGEITDAMLDGFCRLRPSLLSLGSSRRLWVDAARVPADTVLYGNLPSKLFYSDATMPLARVAEQTEELAARMVASGHAFILGTECDTLHVPEHAGTIRAKIDRLLRAG